MIDNKKLNPVVTELFIRGRKLDISIAFITQCYFKEKSLGKLDEYECLTGEEILPSTQQQIIEQAKFTYSPLGKAFEKQTKTIEDQGKKQAKAIEDQGQKQIKTTEKYGYKTDDDAIILREKEIYNGLVDKEKEKVEKLDDNVDYSRLEFKFKSKTADEDFSDYDNALVIIN